MMEVGPIPRPVCVYGNGFPLTGILEMTSMCHLVTSAWVRIGPRGRKT